MAGMSDAADMAKMGSSGKLYASFSDFATILHHYFATSASFQKSRKHPPAALLLLNFNLPKI